MLKKNNLEKFLWLIVFLLPTYSLKAGPFFNVLDILILVAFFSLIIQEEYREKIKKLFWENRKFFLPVGLIFFGLISSLMVNGGWMSGLGIVKSWFLLPIVLVFLLATFSKEKRVIFFGAFFFSAMAVAALSLMMYLFGKTTFDGRLQGIFNSPNYLAMYLCPGLIAGIWFWHQKYFSSKIIFASLFLMALALFLTVSFAAWLAIVFSLVITFFMKTKKRIVWAMLFLTGIFLVFYSQWSGEKFQKIINLEERSSLNSRWMIWKASEKMLEENWLWGIGAGNFQEKYLEYQKFFPPYLEWAVNHPHNIFLSFWLFSGLFGLVGFCWLLVLFLEKIKKNQSNFLSAISLGIMLYLLFHGMADTTYFKNDLAVVFWLTFLPFL